MIQITRQEKDLLAKQFPPHEYPHYYCYPRTMRQDSKRKHYFCVESAEIICALKDIRTRHIIEEHGQIGGASWRLK